MYCTYCISCLSCHWHQPLSFFSFPSFLFLFTFLVLGLILPTPCPSLPVIPHVILFESITISKAIPYVPPRRPIQHVILFWRVIAVRRGYGWLVCKRVPCAVREKSSSTNMSGMPVSKRVEWPYEKHLEHLKHPRPLEPCVFFPASVDPCPPKGAHQSVVPYPAHNLAI
jgi:hypothetical protein